MAAFFTEQLDFIYFFYGLAFFLLGVVCFAIASGRGRTVSWVVFGSFAFLHGAVEWLELIAQVTGDTPPFTIVRITLMTGSFLLLLEFARREAIRFRLRLPGPWLYIPIVLLIGLCGLEGGLSASAAASRYGLGLVGALAASAVFAKHSTGFSGIARRSALSTAAGLALYGLATGIIVPVAPFWPANVLNYEAFIHTTGVPIALVRGVLATWITVSIFAIWGQLLILDVSSDRYVMQLRRQLVWAMVAMTTVLVFGWTLTECFGRIYQQTVEREAAGDITLLASRLTAETSAVDGMVKTLASSRSALALIIGENAPNDGRAQAFLDLNVQASGAGFGYLLDTSGTIVAGSGDRASGVLRRQNVASTPYVQKSLAGEAGRDFVFDGGNSTPDYIASYPVRDGTGGVAGAVVLGKSLDDFAADLMRFGRPCFFIDPNGIIMITNRPETRLRAMWPLPSEVLSPLADRLGTMDRRAVLTQEVADATWTGLDGEHSYTRRQFADRSRWSLVIAMPILEIFASRLLGIIITLFVTVMIVIYLFGRERLVRDNVQTDTRLRLQELARDLLSRATTDPLTGLSNRLKFDEALAAEMLRSTRYGTPLALVLYDIDHFKAVNDTHGHQIGDKVLVTLSQVVANNIRHSDLLCRWGGEEFVILAAGSDAQMAGQAAEKLRITIAQVMFDEVGTVTCSFGIAQYTQGDTAETFIARADDALYRAKSNGRNRVELASQAAAA
jgi:diguanylate cyclase (GGDEF)-like protein